MVRQIRKRYGALEKFDIKRITVAIHKAMLDAFVNDNRFSRSTNVAEKVVLRLNKSGRAIPNVEQVQDTVISSLNEAGYEEVAREYSRYRKEHANIRALKAKMGVEYDALKLSANAVSVLQRRYLVKDQNGRIVETPVMAFERVAKYIAAPDKKYRQDAKKSEAIFYEMLSKLRFMPNSPTLMNAGTGSNQLSACFVLPVEDSLDGIFDSIHKAIKIQQTGGGTGFSFSRLRPNGDAVKASQGVASGPVSFIKVFDAATEAIKQGGKRRGANMGVLGCNHPDIEEFVNMKSAHGVLENFNISVAATDEFMDSVYKNKDIDLINPRNKEHVRSISARRLYELIIRNAWKTGDPGLIFIDEVNRKSPLRKIGLIEATNPCGEQPLLPYESCNLGSINLSKMVLNNEVDWELLGDTIKHSVHFLDNVIDANTYIFEEIAEMTRANRKIGLGIMGWADMLAQLGMIYDSKEALDFVDKLMRFFEKAAKEADVELARRRGSFPNFDKTPLAKKYDALRNSTVTTIAPTGTISIIANASSGIEPFFAISYTRNVMEGTQLMEVNELFKKYAKRHGFYSEELMRNIAKHGTLEKVKGIPQGAKDIFKSAFDISPEWHVRMQAQFQKYIDNAVSKTINLPANATASDVRKAYDMAYRLKCKGITVYRNGSKSGQVLTISGKGVFADSEYSGGCPYPYCNA